MFRFDWSRFDSKIGLIFMAGVLIVFNVMGGSDFAWYAGGISALLAWLTILLVPPQSARAELTGLAVYLSVGAALTWLAREVASDPFSLLVAIFIVTFLAYMVLLKGPHAYMVAWCLLYWFMLAPLFMSDRSLASVVYGHVVGVGLVIALNVIKPLWAGRREPAGAAVEPDAQSGSDGSPSRGYVVGYAALAATAMATGIGMGLKWLTADPTAIANATLNVLSPSFKQVWHTAVERVVLGSAGILIGFYLGWFFPGELIGQVIISLAAFATLATARVSFGIVIGFFFLMLAYPWGAMRTETGHLIANEKLIGEFVGIVIAITVIGMLVRLRKKAAA